MAEHNFQQDQDAKATAMDGHSLKALSILASQPLQSQREVALALGLSIGRTNFIVRALLEKGYLKVNNFRLSNNKLAYAYVLTPSGFAKKLQLTRAFIHHKEREFEVLRQAIAELKNELEKGEEPVTRKHKE